eukprot:Awhi_evm1s209
MGIFLDLISSYGSSSYQTLFLIQFLAVLYAFCRVGRGPYWVVLFAAALAGFIGMFLETICGLLIAEGETNPNEKLYALLIVAEPCWITLEFSVVFLNLIKLKALLSSKHYNYMRIFVAISFLCFVGCRFYVGATRYIESVTYNDAIWKAHFPAFACLAVTELILTIVILVICRKKQKEENGTSLFSILLTSNLFTLIVVDGIGIFLAISSFVGDESEVFSALITPLNVLKSSFPLLLAVDALVVKILNSVDRQTRTGKSRTTKNSENKKSRLHTNSTTASALSKSNDMVLSTASQISLSGGQSNINVYDGKDTKEIGSADS